MDIQERIAKEEAIKRKERAQIEKEIALMAAEDHPALSHKEIEDIRRKKQEEEEAERRAREAEEENQAEANISDSDMSSDEDKSDIDDTD